jgi:endonuclease/exonuclease/phosphatase family metal-dependent hydrolase
MFGYSRRLLSLLLFTPALCLALAAIGCVTPSNSATEAGPGEYLFCFWNVENFFDDKLQDPPYKEPDRGFDAWFAKDKEARELKLKHLTDVLIKLNGGKGPDILALAEVESERAAELLRESLNARLKDESQRYQHILFKDPNGGRHIATAIITRLPVVADRTRLHGRRQRILEGHIKVNGKELVVIASHWTSRVTDKEGRNRADYGDKIHGAFRAMFERNKDVAFLVCGDFNDTPDDPSVTKHLRAIGGRDKVRDSREPLLLNLFAEKDPNKFGTHYHFKWMIFDQIAVSRGLLGDTGWTCEPDSAATVQTPPRPKDPLKRPWSFGTPQHPQNGYSDHFPVTVKLHIGER